jgi:hypothetical protein
VYVVHIDDAAIDEVRKLVQRIPRSDGTGPANGRVSADGKEATIVLERAQTRVVTVASGIVKAVQAPTAFLHAS